MKKRRNLSALVLAALLSMPLQGQDAFLHSFVYRDTARAESYKQFCIYFEINSTVPDRRFKSNEAILSSIEDGFERMESNSLRLPDTLYIRSTASPDGPVETNRRLARERGLALKDTVLRMFPELSESTFLMEEIPEDWRMLERLVLTEPECPDAEAVLGIIRDPGTDGTVKKAALKKRRGFFIWLQREQAHRTRYASLAYAVNPERLPGTIIPVPSVTDTLRSLPPSILPPAFVPVPVPQPQETVRRMILAPRTNLLVPLLNAGVEVPIGKHHSVGADFYSPWFLDPGNRWCFQLQCLSAGYRYWFGGGKNGKYDWTQEKRLVGHAVGTYVHAGHYDFQRTAEEGYQGEFAGGGLEWVFGLPVAKEKLRMEFSFGVGYLWHRNRHYTPNEEHTVLIKDLEYGDRVMHYFGPTRACVSFVIPIYAKRKN